MYRSMIIFALISAFCIHIDTAGVCSKPEPEEALEQQKASAPVEISLDKFEEDLKGYIRSDNAWSSAGMMDWFDTLKPMERFHLAEIYNTLLPKDQKSEQDPQLLKNCVFEMYNSYALHQTRFSRDYINMLGKMDVDLRRQFFLKMCGMLSPDELGYKWFSVVSTFFTQLPEEERTITSLDTLRGLLHVELLEDGRYRHFDVTGSNRRLWRIKEILDEDEMLNMEETISLLRKEPTYWERIREESPNILISASLGLFASTVVYFGLY